jgi:sterol desaturase/sphingolipid hydroxylase (fatty acid hydroxylase superfamily)
MTELINFFSDVPLSFRTSILLGGIVFFWVLEGMIPLYSFRYKKINHALLNIFFTTTTAIIGFGFAFLLLKSTLYVGNEQIGFIHIFNLPTWANVIISLLLLDLIGAYLVHFIQHKVPWMWKFHLVHHSDMNVDVTTGLRHHPGETVFRIIFTIIGVFVSGASIGMVMLYQSLSVLFAHITHANINIPKKIDSILSYVLVTPNMHKIHHHYEMPLTDSNYGNIFSIWDRLFNTFSFINKQKSVVYGIDTYMDKSETNNLGTLLSIPFKKLKKINNSKFSK